MVRLASFSIKYQTCPVGYTRIDCRKFRNPHHVSALQDLDGRRAEVQSYMTTDPKFMEALNRLEMDVKDGQMIAFGCVGGKHRSVAMAEMLAKRLAARGVAVEKRHLNCA